MFPLLQHLRNWLDTSLLASSPAVTTSSPESVKPQLPFELIQLILHHLWHSSLSRRERIHLMTTSPRISRSYMKSFVLVSSESIYLPSSSYMSYLFLTILQGRSRVYSPDFADIGLSPSLIQVRCRSLTIHVEPSKSLFLRRAEAYCRTGDITLFYQSDPGILFPHLYHLCHTYGLIGSLLPNTSKLVLEFRNQIPSRYDAVRIFAAISSAGASSLAELGIRYGWDEDTPECILDAFSSRKQWTKIREVASQLKEGLEVLPEKELQRRIDHSDAIRRSGLPLTRTKAEGEKCTAENTVLAPTPPIKARSNSESKPPGLVGIRKDRSQSEIHGKEWALDLFGISCCQELSSICESSVLLSSLPSASATHLNNFGSLPRVFNPVAPQIQTLSVYGVCGEMVMNLATRCPRLRNLMSDVGLEKEWIGTYLNGSCFDGSNTSSGQQEPKVDWDVGALVRMWEKEGDDERKRLRCALHGISEIRQDDLTIGINTLRRGSV
ncbi:hypothetical protein VKT23_006237 [Stygiomarasmius scandens]|uniref:F-box domain-containing protein n=1 Tax=Marasmiellus scandens TaxID=2682957 RepID=A0ABR1JM96_9AGAR